MKAVLLYALESWTVTQKTIDRLQVFVNKCLRRILDIHWPDKISKELWRKTDQEPVLVYLRRRQRNWRGHRLRKSGDNISKQALKWTAQGHRGRGRPKNTRRRELENEMWTAGFGPFHARLNSATGGPHQSSYTAAG